MLQHLAQANCDSPAKLSRLGFAGLCEEAGHGSIVPPGALELSFHGSSREFHLGEVEGEAPQQGVVLQAVVLAGPGLVLVHGHLEHAVQPVLDAPVGASHLAEALGG